MTYMNELEVEVDFSDVDPNLLEQASESDSQIPVLSMAEGNSKIEPSNPGSELVLQNIGLGDDKPKTTITGRASRFFRKKE
jgi:hypothetical protein